MIHTGRAASRCHSRASFPRHRSRTYRSCHECPVNSVGRCVSPRPPQSRPQVSGCRPPSLHRGPEMMKVVGVIGAGAGGLCAARHISASPCMRPVVWEKASKVGGTWVYSPHVGKDEHGLPIHSSMYKNLKTNLPKELMAFPDYSFPAKEESFLHHTEVLNYLEDYARHYDLNQYIKFNHHVEEVKPVSRDNGTTGWAVTVQDLETRTITTSMCDGILVCNGHYSVPRMPSIQDIDKFRGSQMHSHDYRKPEPFRGLRVVVLGAAASGLDIALELATVAKEVILSHNHPVQVPSEFPSNVRQVRGAVAAHEDGFIFADKSQADADAIIYCTGYEFTFPFLSEECGVTVEDNIVKPLYKHIINTAFPSMGFIGIPMNVVPFPLFDVQVRFFLAMLAEDITPLTRQEMDAVITHELQLVRHRDGHTRHFYHLGPEKCNRYMRELMASAHLFPDVPSHFLWFFKLNYMKLIFSCATFKQSQYSLEADGQVREWRNGREISTRWELTWLLVVQIVRLLWRDFGQVFSQVFSSAAKSFRNCLGIH